MDGLKKVYVEPTTQCNLTCLTCMRHAWDEPCGDMDWSVFRSLVDGLAGFPSARTIAFAGIGEPLSHPRFVEMVCLAHGRGFRTEVTSNSLLLTPSLARNLLKAGLDQFVVSIDGVSDATYGGIRSGASLAPVISNIRLLVPKERPPEDSSLRIGIEFVAMKRNIRELPELAQIAAAVGASFVLVSNVLPYTPDLQDEILYRFKVASSDHDETRLKPTWILPNMEWSLHTREPLSRVLRAGPDPRSTSVRLDRSANFCPFVSAGSLAVAWNGAISPCPPLMHSHSLYIRGRRKFIRSYEAGRLPERSLRAIWEDPTFAALRQRVREFDFPACVDCGCDQAKSNEEDCWFNPFPVCGDCLWARGVIRCA